MSNGTSNAAEVFAAALLGNKRADLVGEPTAGVAALQKLVRLPQGYGLWLTYERHMTVDGAQPIHERGLPPDLGVAEPDDWLRRIAADDRRPDDQGGRAAQDQALTPLFSARYTDRSPWARWGRPRAA